MVQLLFLSGRPAGTSIAARRFPFRIGRSARADFQLLEEGVWEDHLVLSLRRGEGIIATAQPPATLWLNGEAIEEKRLVLGDVLTLGNVALRFGLAPARQKSLRWREMLTWFCAIAVCLGQIALIYWLIT